MSVNPFATKFTRPGALPYWDPAVLDERPSAKIVEGLANHNGFGSIVGPHGSGKSTLAYAVARLFLLQGGQVAWYTLNERGRWTRRPIEAEPIIEPSRGDVPRKVWIVEGWDRLTTPRRWMLRQRARLFGHGLLVTTHADCELPIIWRTSANAQLLRRLIEKLAPGFSSNFSDQDLNRLLDEYKQNVREILFLLYDAYALGNCQVKLSKAFPTATEV